MIPIKHHADAYFQPREALFALGIVFGTIGFMRLVLVFLAGNLF
jgi:hypothetical protein